MVSTSSIIQKGRDVIVNTFKWYEFIHPGQMMKSCSSLLRNDQVTVSLCPELTFISVTIVIIIINNNNNITAIYFSISLR